jgi:NADH-quinone oxidoreductase subunit C
MVKKIENLLNFLSEKYTYQTLNIQDNHLTIRIKNDDLISIVDFIKNDENCLFTKLVDIFGVDFPDRINRFEVNYIFLSIVYNLRLIIKVEVAENNYINSLYSVFPGCIWFEREAYDMYGIHFENNPDLRRILTDYGFEGHPLRKDFPLTGFKEVRYDYTNKKVIYEPVNLSQEYRNFDYLSPWEGTKYILPGDEKTTNEGGK